MSLYLEASAILTSAKGSLKSRVFSPSKKWKSPPNRLYALIIETLKHQLLLREIIIASSLLTYERKLTYSLALLLLHDHLLTKNGISTSSGPLKDALLRHRARLGAELTRARVKRGYASVAEMLKATEEEEARGKRLVRWGRVNTLVGSTAEVVRSLGFSAVGSLEDLLKPGAGEVYYEDPYVPHLLAFPPGLDLTKHALYLDGTIILQDRSSCFPAAALAPPVGATVLDATAAPGNKTTHLAALVGTGGRVVAFEKDVRRAETLKKMVSKAKADRIVEVRAGEDFLATRPQEEGVLATVGWILLDPSCSGSGIVGREEVGLLPLPEEPKKGKKRKAQTEVVLEEKNDIERLKALSEFQQKMILHAMTFPKARFISYSTCSIHRKENEDVVTAVLASKVARRRGWKVKTGLMPTWERRGVFEYCESEEVAKACVRCNAVEDGGIGFFVAVFQRDTMENEGELDCRENDSHMAGDTEEDNEEDQSYEEWHGFSEEEGIDQTPSTSSLSSKPPKKKQRKNKAAKNTK